MSYGFSVIIIFITPYHQVVGRVDQRLLEHGADALKKHAYFLLLATWYVAKCLLCLYKGKKYFHFIIYNLVLVVFSKVSVCLLPALK